MWYFIRMDLPSWELLDNLKGYSRKWATVDEKKDTNPHTHMLIETDCSETIVRSDLKQEYGKAGNKKWSCKVVGTGEEAKVLGYMYKEGEPSVYCIDDDMISDAQAINDQIQESKKSKGTMFKRIMDDAQIKEMLEEEVVIQRDIIDRIVTMFVDAGKTINPNVIANLVLTVLANSKHRVQVCRCIDDRVDQILHPLRR